MPVGIENRAKERIYAIPIIKQPSHIVKNPDLPFDDVETRTFSYNPHRRAQRTGSVEPTFESEITSVGLVVGV